MSNQVRSCEIGPIAVQQHRGASRVRAKVAGEWVWFESRDVPLKPSAEALVSAFLILSLHHHMPLHLQAPLSGVLRGNLERMCRTLHEWWDYPETPDISCEGESVLSEKPAALGQCFSGGADSFYSLLRGKHPSQYLVYVHGYDMSHRDRHRMRRFRASLDAVAQAMGCKAIVVRTNLREHRLFRSLTWERTHGGALAAVGHLLSDVIGGLVIPSSYPYDDYEPHGSHWMIDPLWSSENIDIIHDDASLYRLYKLKKIDEEPLVRHHLRVCWENRAVSGNCSRCDKCVRTMIMLSARNQLQHYSAFDRRTPLPDIIDRMDPPPAKLHRRYEQLLEEDLSEEVVAAIHRLLVRDRTAPLAGLRRKLRGLKLGLARICP